MNDASGSEKTGGPTVRDFVQRHASFAKYVLVGGFNTVLDLGLFSLLVAVFNVAPLVANTVSTIVTMSVSYFLNRSFVFASTRSHTKAAVPFIVVTLTSGLVIQSAVITAVIAAGDTLLDIPHDLLAAGAKVVAIGVGMVSNYLGYRFVFNGWGTSALRRSTREAGR